jgi:hypothetical protein
MAPVTVTYIFQPFLPPVVPQPARPRVAPHGAKRGGSDREAEPSVQRARDLGKYGFNLLEAIDKVYLKQVTVWKDAFGEVVAAWATAVDMRNKTFEAAHEERERDAARDAFIFSLLTSGAMVFVSAWVQYSLQSHAHRTGLFQSECHPGDEVHQARWIHPNSGGDVRRFGPGGRRQTHLGCISKACTGFLPNGHMVRGLEPEGWPR